MNNFVRVAALLSVGLASVSIATPRITAQSRPNADRRLNHIGISVTNVEEATRFYTKAFGFHEAYTLRDKDGNPTMASIQMSRDTFLELTPATADRQPGISHFGMEVDDIQATVMRLRGAGAQVPDTRVPANTNATITSLTDPDGLRAELLQLTPGSLQRKAVDTWQQSLSTGLRLNSVGMSVKNFDDAFSFYTKTLGFREAFTLRDKDGKPTLAFLQISPATFLELLPATPNRPAGFTGVLLETSNIQATVMRLRQAGVEVRDPRLSPVTNTMLTSLTGPAGTRVELLELTPGSLIGKAVESWGQ
ncbi:MAG: VOC family protein [Vicinamibacterales bacterium]